MKVLIGTPAHDGRVDVWYANSLVNTVKLSGKYNTEIYPVYMSYDSLVQRARNDLVRLALEDNFDALIFIDSDEEWDPEWVFSLLARKEDVIGAPVIKKTDREIAFNVKALKDNLQIKPNGLLEVECVGTGFMKLTRVALQKVWDISPEYSNEGRKCRMVFDVKLIDGELFSEDNVFCQKWRELGGKVWIDPAKTCNHIGVKKYQGSFLALLQHLNK